jgi:glutathione S-transferase
MTYAVHPVTKSHFSALLPRCTLSVMVATAALLALLISLAAWRSRGVAAGFGLPQQQLGFLPSLAVSNPVVTTTTLSVTTRRRITMSKSSSSSSSSSLGMSTSMPPESSTGLILYGHPGTRSPLINWACLELQLNWTMGDLQCNPHPFGQMPCLTDHDGDVVVFESGAILQYIHENYSTSLLLSRKDRAAITSWIMWANASLDPICFKENNGRVYDTGLCVANRRMDRLDSILSSQQWLVSNDAFTLADVAVASYLAYVLQFFPDVTLADKWPAAANYVHAAVQRPTYGQAFGVATQSRLLAGLAKDIAAATAGSTKAPPKLFGMF